MTEKIANDFVTKLKAHGTSKDFCDLAAAHEEFHAVLIKLPPKEKTLFSLNVLCILCRYVRYVLRSTSITYNQSEKLFARLGSCRLDTS